MGRISTRIQYTLDVLFSHSSTTSSQASIFIFLLKEHVAAIADWGAFQKTVSLDINLDVGFKYFEFSPPTLGSDPIRLIFFKWIGSTTN